MFYNLRRIWNPAVFQGASFISRGRRKTSQRGYFEGWYFKSVDASGSFPLALIPGISLAGADSHAFIQVFDGRVRKAGYHRFPLSDFQADTKECAVSIGGNSFSLRSLSVDLPKTTGLAAIRAELSFARIIPWPVRAFSPGAMGWYAFVPGMECYHGVLSFNHRIEGWVEQGADRCNFDGGKGYIEKDWGLSMPSAWIWMQTNHFGNADVSLFLSAARIPWRGNFFTGHIAGLYLCESFYPFATYTGAALKEMSVSETTVSLVLTDRRYELMITGHRQPGVDLPAPRRGEMTAKVNESLQSTVDVLLRKKSGGVVFEGTGTHAGLECVGNLEAGKVRGRYA